MGQIRLLLTLVLIGLFSIAVIGYAINFASDNNAPIDISDDAEFSALNTQLQGNMSNFGEAGEDTYSSIINTTIEPEGQVFQSSAPFSITPLSAIGVVTSILYVSYQKIFGTGTGFGIFVTTFIGVIVFMIGLYIYKTLRGNPD